MSDRPAPSVRSALPFADNVNIVATDQPFRWLAAGWRDFRAAGMISIAQGMIFVVAGLVLTIGLHLAGLTYLIAPLVAGFMLVGGYAAAVIEDEWPLMADRRAPLRTVR